MESGNHVQHNAYVARKLLQTLLNDSVGWGMEAGMSMHRVRERVLRQLPTTRRLRRTLLWSASLLATAAALAPHALLPAAAADDLKADDQAALLLNAARRAYNDRNYPQAANQFRDFVQKFPNHGDAPAGWYGLGLALIDGPRDYPAAAEAFSKAAAVAGFSERGLATYFNGVALRGLANAATQQAKDKPAEAEVLKRTAAAKYDEAALQFSLSIPLLAAAPDWVARARCDQAECLLRNGKYKEAAAAIQPAVDGNGADAKLRPLALYHAGHAQFGLKDYTAAGRALSQLAPFDQEFGPHARFLLGRVHQLSGERPEAMAQYKAVTASFNLQRTSAKQKLQNANALPADRRAFLESIANGPVPDYVSRSAFYQAVLLSEDGKFPEAKELFAKFAAEAKTHPLAPEAQLRVGYCQLQSRQYPDAINSLTALKDHAQLGDQATWWLSKAQLLQADPANAQVVEAAGKNAVEPLRRAADRANQLAATEPAAKLRRAEILMDLAEAQIQGKLFRDAAGTYQVIINENASPERVEEAAQRIATAFQLAGAFPESDQACEQFEKRFPKSTLLPAVWFRSAENAFMQAGLAAKPETPRPELERLYGNAILRYQKVVEKYPEFQHVNLARQGIAMSYYRLGKFEQAGEMFTKIPDADRQGDLSTVSYLQADALIRTFPPETDDALRAAGLIQTAEQAAKLMEGFGSGNPKSPLAPDALLKYGYCYQRMASLLADKQERAKAIQVSREAYEKHLKTFRDHPTGPAVVFERAKLMVLQGDIGGAMNELRRFQNDPLKNSPDAPLAAMRLASLMRSERQTKEAAELLNRVRTEQEANLAKDPARADWIPALFYEHALAVKDAGQLPEARAMFDQISQKFPGKPEATNALWRSVQCRREELAKQIGEAKQKFNQPASKAEELAAAGRTIEEAAKAAAAAGQPLNALADQFIAQKQAGSEGHVRVLYELAWCDRTAADAEIELARQKSRRDALERIIAKLPKNSAQPAANLLAPEVDPAAVPMQPAEVRAKDRYQKLIAAGPDQPLAVRARFELAELIADRGDFDGALDLLNGALLSSTDAELSQRCRLRMAACFLGKGDGKTALAAVKPIVDAGIKPNQPTQWTPLLGEARFIHAESAIQTGDWNKAIELLTVFRDQDALRNMPGVSDRAMLRLGQAYAKSKQWIPSYQAFEGVVQRYPQSIWMEEARFGMGISLQSQGRFDEAVNAYTEVTRRTAAEVAARAQVQIGLSRMEQKKYAEATTALLAVPYTYDYPEWSAAACYEAARAFKEMQKPKEAADLWKKVIDDYPGSKSAPLARAKLAEIK